MLTRRTLRAPAVFVSAIVACAPTASRAAWDWERPGAVEAALFLASETLIAIDGLQTLDLKNHRLASGAWERTETNPLLGSHPSDRVIVGWTAAALLANGLVWYVLPHPFRGAYSISLIFVEVDTVSLNAVHGMRLTLPF